MFLTILSATGVGGFKRWTSRPETIGRNAGRAHTSFRVHSTVTFSMLRGSRLRASKTSPRVQPQIHVSQSRFTSMSLFFTLVAWTVLLVLCWPLAFLVLLLYPLLWLLSIPFRIVGYALGGVLAFIKALLFLPARLLGAR
jgi:hypothetical protein